MNRLVTVLVGPQGSGKSTYCQQELAGHLRISQDEQGRAEHFLHYEESLRQGVPAIVVDRINHLRYQRERYLTLARQHGYRTRIVWFNVDRNVCIRRCKARTDHPTLPPEDAEKAVSLYFNTLQPPSRREADELVILGQPPRYEPVVDLSAELANRRYLIVGDVHGCFDEMIDLLTELHFDPAEDVLISVGDLVDRGPKVREVLAYCIGLPRFQMVLGNHEHKLIRYLEGHGAKRTGGMDVTLQSVGEPFPPEWQAWLKRWPRILRTPAGYVVHAGFVPDMSPEEQYPADCIFMRCHGGKTYFDEINGRPWYHLWPTDQPRVFFGHIPMDGDTGNPQAVSLDGGCVFGGELRIFDSRDGQVHRRAARQAYAVNEHARKLTETSPIEAIQKREELVVAGLLRKDETDDGELAIYTYTDACVYENAWDDITRYSRGHVYHKRTGECVAYAFPKFFNLNENKESQVDQYPWDQPFEVYDKMDGWLGVLYRHQGRFHVASRGSFHSTGAQWATRYIQLFDLSCLPDEATLCFEIIHPDHQIILDYQGQESLVILGAFNRQTGVEYPRHTVEEWARRTGLALVPLRAAMSLQELLDHQKKAEGIEGFVLRFADGRRVKVKTEWYLNLARLMSDLSPITVWEALEGGKVPVAHLRQIPEELRPIAERYQAVLEGQYARIRLAIDEALLPLLREHGPNRKALALALDADPTGIGRWKKVAFALLDGKLDVLDQWIKQQIYPASNRFVSDLDYLGTTQATG